MNTTDIPEIMKEMAVSRETATEISYHRTLENKLLAAQWPAKKAALKASADAAYDAEVARYKEKNPSGKNAAKAGLRKAREVWSGYTRF
jgi:hypothetical protein